MIRVLIYVLFLINRKEHKFTIQWCLSDKKTNERIFKDFIISQVGVIHKNDICNKRLINKAISKKLNINKKINNMVKNGEIPKDCILSYNIICYYGKMNC